MIFGSVQVVVLVEGVMVVVVVVVGTRLYSQLNTVIEVSHAAALCPWSGHQETDSSADLCLENNV